MIHTSTKLSLLILIYIIIQATAIGPVSQCEGGQFQTDLFQIQPAIWSTKELKFLGDSQLIETKNSQTNQVIASQIQLFKNVTNSAQNSNSGTVSHSAVWYNRLLGISDRTMIEFTLDLTDTRCGQVQLYPGVLIDNTNDCGPQGFAFVVSQDSIDAIGGFGSGLGYDGVRGIFVVEFDMRVDFVNNDDNRGKSYQISVIQRDISNGSELNSSEVYSVMTNIEPSVNFASDYAPNAKVKIGILPMPVSANDKNKIQVYVSINGQAQISGAIIDLDKAGGSTSRLYNYGFTGTNYVNDIARATGNLKLQNLKIYKSRPIKTTFNTKVIDQQPEQVLIQLSASANDSCQAPTSIFTLLGAEFRFDFKQGVKSCTKQGVQTRKNLQNHQFSDLVYIKIKCSSSGEVNTKSSYTLDGKQFSLNGDQFVAVKIARGVFENLAIEIPTSLLNGDKFKAQGKVQTPYSFQIDVKNFFSKEKLTTAQEIKPLITIEEPRVTYSDQFDNSSNSVKQKKAIYQLNTDFTLTSQSPISSTFTLTFTPKIGGSYSVHSLSFIASNKYQITIVQQQKVSSQLSLAALTTPAPRQDFEVPTINAGQQIVVQLTIKDKDGKDILVDDSISPCNFDQSYYADAQKPNQQLKFTVTNQRQLVANVEVAGTINLVPRIRCDQQANPVDLNCQQCQVKVQALTDFDLQQTKFIDNLTIEPQKQYPASIIQGDFFSVVAVMRDKYGNDIKDTSSITISTAKIQSNQGVDLINLQNRRDPLTQKFILSIPTAELTKYYSLIPRTGYYKIQLTAPSQSAVTGAFNLVPSDFTGPAIGSGDYSIDYTSTILIFPENAKYLKAGQIAQLYINLRTNNLLQQDQDKSSEITAKFYTFVPGVFGIGTSKEDVKQNQCPYKVQKVSDSRPGNYVIYFSCTTATEKFIDLVLNGNTSTLLNTQILLRMSANFNELTLTMSGEDATYYDNVNNKVFKNSINEVPFQLRDKFKNVYNGQQGIKNIAYQFKNAQGTKIINSSLQSVDGVSYKFKFPYSSPDYKSYTLTFNSQFNAATNSQIIYTFPKTEAAEIELSPSKSTCRLQNVSKDTILIIGNAPLLVKCVGFTQDNLPAQFNKLQRFSIYAVNQDGIQKLDFKIQTQPGNVIGQISYTLSQDQIKKQGIYVIKSNIQGILVQNNIVRVTDQFSLAKSKVLRGDSFLIIRTGQDQPLSLDDAPIIFKKLEYPSFKIQFYGVNDFRVDLSLGFQNVVSIFTVNVKKASDSSVVNLSLDLFVNQGIQLQVAIASSTQNRQLFDSLADGLYYLDIVYSPASDSIRAYFQIQDVANPTSNSSIDYSKTLFKTKQFNAIAGIPFDVIFTFRGADLARVTQNLPSLSSFTAVADPNAVTAPQIRLLTGPVQGVYVIELTLKTAIKSVTVTFSTGNNIVGSIQAKVSPGILDKLQLIKFESISIEVGSPKIVTLVPRDFYQNQIESMYSMSPDRITKLISISYDFGYTAVGRVSSDKRFEIQVSTQVAGTLQFTPFLSNESKSIQFTAKRIPSPKYSYTQFQAATVIAGTSTSLRLFLFDEFKNQITAISDDEITFFTIYLKCIDDQDKSIKPKILVRNDISGVITPKKVIATSSSSGYLSYQLPNDKYMREACVYQSFTFYSPTAQSSNLQKIPCTQCTLTVNHGQLALAQTLIIDARGAQWSSNDDQSIDFVLSRNVDYLSIPVIFRDQYQNIIPYKSVFKTQSQQLTGAFQRGSNQPALCFNKSLHVLEFCAKGSDALKWKAYKASQQFSELTLTMSQGGGTVQFQTTISGNDAQDFNSDNLPLNLQNTQINLFQNACNTEESLITNSVQGEITLRTTTGMRTQNRLTQADLKDVFKFKSSDPSFNYQIIQLMETGKYRFKLHSSRARVQSPISLQFVNEKQAPYSLNKTLTSVSIPQFSKSISPNLIAKSPALFNFVCLAGNTPKKLNLFNFDNKIKPITTTQLLKSATIGKVYQLYVQAFDANNNSIQFNTQSLDVHDLVDLKITYTTDGSRTNSLPYITTPTQTEDLILVEFTPIIAASDYKVESPILQVNNSETQTPQNFAPLTSSLGQPQSRRCIIQVNKEHKASTSQAFQVWVQVRDTFDNYLDPQSLQIQKRNDFGVQVKWWINELNDFTDYQDLGDPVVSTKTGVLNKNFLKWSIALARVGQTVFRADYRGQNIQCKNCMTLVKVGDLLFSNTLVTYISAITLKQFELKDTLVLNNLSQYPNLRIYPRDQAGNLLSSFQFGGSSVVSSINGNIALEATGSNSSSNLVIRLSSASISSYNGLSQGSYQLQIGSSSTDQVIKRSLYLLGGNTDGAINAEIDPQLTQISIQDDILDIVAGKDLLFEVTVRVSTGQRRNTFNPVQNQITFFVQNQQQFSGDYSYNLPKFEIKSSQIAGKFSIRVKPTQATQFAPTNVYLRLRIGPSQIIVNKIRIQLVIHADIPRLIEISSDSIGNGTVLKQGNADDGYSFKYKALDKFNNAISLESSQSYRYDFSVLRLTQIQNNVRNFVYAKYSLSQNKGSGQVQCKLQFPILASDYKIVSSLFASNNQQYTFKVISGQAAIPYSSGSISLSASRRVVAGSELQFKIFARDKNGNPVSRNASGQFQARIITPKGQIKTTKLSQQSSTDSQYLYSFTATEAGEHRWIPYYALLRMISIANTVVVNPGPLDLGKSGNGIYYYDGSTETSRNYFIPIIDKSFKLKIGAAFKLRLDYADKYGNQIDTSDAGNITSDISFENGTISGNGITNDIQLVGKKIKVGTKNWIEYEIKAERLIDYNRLLGKSGYSVVLKAQDSSDNRELASTTLSLELISAQGEQKNASNGVADLTKTALIQVKGAVRAGEKGVFIVELRSADGKRSVATPPFQSSSSITVSNPDASDSTPFSYAVSQLQKRGQYKIQLLYTKSKISSLANSSKEPADSSTIDFFDSKKFKISISGTQIQGVDISLTVFPGNVDFGKTNITFKPTGQRDSGLQNIKFLLKDKYDNKFVSSSLVLDRLRMFVNDRYYSRKLLIGIERDDQDQLGKYVIAFQAFVPPISWKINVYYVQNDFTKTPIYLNSFPTAQFTLKSNLQVAQTQYLGVDLTSGIQAGKKLEIFLLLRDQLGYCYKDNVNVKTTITGPGKIDPATDVFIANNGFQKIQAIVEGINNQFGDCYRYYKITTQVGKITQAGTYYIESTQTDDQGASIQSLGKGRTLQVYQGQADKNKIRLYFKQTRDQSIAFRQLNGDNLKVRVGESKKFYINTFDQYGNPILNQRYASFQITAQDPSKLPASDFKFIVSYQFGNGTYPVTTSFSKTSQDGDPFKFNYKFNGEDITSTIILDDFGPKGFQVLPGECIANQIRIPDLSDISAFNCKEGNQCQFTITCRDALGNDLKQGVDLVSVAIRSYSLQDKSSGLTGVSLDNTVINQNNGSYKIIFNPSYAGQYAIIFYVNNIPKDIAVNFKVRRSVCAADQIYCYGDKKCAKSFNECTNVQEKRFQFCKNNPNARGPVYCLQGGLGTCVPSRYDCDVQQGFKKCQASRTFLPVNQFDELCYSKFQLDCKSISPNTSYQCNDGTCRRNEDECPTNHVCPPGTYLCPDFSCTSLQIGGIPQCDYQKVAQPCTFPTPFKCYDSTCAADLASCPTGMTCSNPNHVICPDNQCVENQTKCKKLRECPSGEVKCDDGSCALNFESCPQRPSCGASKGLCEDYTCRLQCVNIFDQTRLLQQAPDADNKTNNNILACPGGTIKCPTGECLTSYNLCPSRRVCPSKLIKCSDDSCAVTINQCLIRTIQVVPNKISCFDGIIVESLSECPTRVSCPSKYPIKCHDNFCVDNISKCSPYVECPKQAPFRCWSSDCRASVSDCPSAFHCPKEMPVLCQDGSCHQDAEECQAIVKEIGSCLPNQIRCSNGICASAKSLCPSLPTCSGAKPLMCWDGKCVNHLSQCQNPNGQTATCSNPQSKYRCPDGSCVSTLQNCATELSCPTDTPVRCSDFSCRSKASDCPDGTKYLDCPSSTIPCPDGSCSSTNQCSQGVSCPLSAPFLCQDSTCRKDPVDCPKIVTCLSGQYLCKNGKCVDDRRNCPQQNNCPSNKPVRCPDLSCYNSISECQGQNNFGCPRGFFKCVDSSCKEDAQLCSQGTGNGSSRCPRQASVLCQDGNCSFSAEYCSNVTVDCPFYAPNKCKNGKCATLLTDCDSDNQITNANCLRTGWILCPDGSCAPTVSSCPSSNGCLSGVQCGNGKCAVKQCPVNVCPGDRSYKCPNGICVTSPRFCLNNISTEEYAYCKQISTSVSKIRGVKVQLIPCGNGQCLNNSQMCPPLYDCPTGKIRCGDGSCRESELLCPIVGNTCPPHISFRCLSGMCAKDQNSCQISNGCPPSFPQLCPDGQCVNNLAQCDNSENKQWIYQSNGCPQERKVKCWNGACVASQAECPLTNLCPSARPIKCGLGNCVATSAKCGPQIKCPDGYFRCPDFTCRKKWSDCISSIGCPIKTPFRCADGSCAAVGNALLGSNYCPAGVGCSKEKPFRCHNGECKGNSNFCKLSLPFEKCTGQTTTRCNDGSCAKSFQECPKITCPQGAPFLCSNGKCTTNSLQCEQKTICPSDQPISCVSGICVSNPSFCVPQSIANGSKSTNGDIQGECTKERPYLCYDGSCMKEFRQCPLLPSCTNPFKPIRCQNGQCVSRATQCTASSTIVCTQNFTRCEDGYCRKKCPQFNGCPTSRPFQCQNGFCGIDISDCASVSNCPYEKPFRCIDYQCKASMTQCSLPPFMSKPAKLTITFSSIATGTFPIIYSPRTNQLQGELSIPSSAIVPVSRSLQQQTKQTSSNTSLNIYPIPDSELSQTFYIVSQKRINDVRNNYTLDNSRKLKFYQILLSAAIELEVNESQFQSQFSEPITLSLFVNIPSHVNRLQDICIAQLPKTQANKNKWQCINRAHSFDQGSSLATFQVNSTGKYAVIYAPNENFDSSNLYQICGSWSCDAPSDFLLLVFLGPLVIIISLLITYFFLMMLKKKRRMQEKLEKAQQGLFYQSDSDFEGKETKDQAIIREGLDQTEMSQITAAPAGRHTPDNLYADESALTTQHNLDHSDIRPFVGEKVRRNNIFESTIPRLKDKIQNNGDFGGLNLQRQFDDEVKNQYDDGEGVEQKQSSNDQVLRTSQSGTYSFNSSPNRGENGGGIEVQPNLQGFSHDDLNYRNSNKKAKNLSVTQESNINDEQQEEYEEQFENENSDDLGSMKEE